MPKTQDIQIEHFPDRSLRRLLQDREYVRGLVQIIAPDIEGFLDFNRIIYQKEVLSLKHYKNASQMCY